jgi:hypothetical protein
MAQRSRAAKVEDGRKATARKIAQYGPDEPNRAARQAAWTKEHSGRNKSENPHLREKVYEPADFPNASIGIINSRFRGTPVSLASALSGRIGAPVGDINAA